MTIKKTTLCTRVPSLLNSKIVIHILMIPLPELESKVLIVWTVMLMIFFFEVDRDTKPESRFNM